MPAPGSLQSSDVDAGDSELAPQISLIGVVLIATAVDPLTENPRSRYRGGWDP